MDTVKLSRVSAGIGTLVLAATLSAQGNVRWAWQGPVEYLPHAVSLGGDTGEVRFREVKSNGVNYISFRAAQAMATTFRLRWMDAIGNANDCVKRGTSSTDGDGFDSAPLVFAACGGSGSEWISATEDASNNHTSTVYSNTAGNRVGWVVNRYGGTEAAPADSPATSRIFDANYQARVGGVLMPQFDIVINRQTATATSVADYVFRTFDAAGGFYDKLRIHDRIYLGADFYPDVTGTRRIGDSSVPFLEGSFTGLRTNTIASLSGNLLITSQAGSPVSRIPKIWVTDFDCSGTGCPGGANVWSRDASGFLFPTTVTDDVRVRKIQYLDVGGSGLLWDSYAEVAGAGTRAQYFRDNAGAYWLWAVRSFLGNSENNLYIDMNLVPSSPAGKQMGYSHYRWGNFFGSAGDFAGNVTPDSDWNVGNRQLGTTSLRWGGIATRNIDINGTFTCTGTGCPATGWNFGPPNILWTGFGWKVGIGTAVPGEALEILGGNFKVSGGINIGGNLLWSSDGAGTIGTTTNNRPSQVFATTGFIAFQGAGSSQQRASMSSGGFLAFSGAGTTVFSVSANSGALVSQASIDAVQGFRVGGTLGLTRFASLTCFGSGFAANVQWTLGILTSFSGGC